MKTILLFLACTILCVGTQAYAEPKQGTDTNAIPRLLGTNDYSSAFQMPTEMLTAEQQVAVKTVASSKVATRNSAWAILAERSESLKWMTSALSRMLDRGLRKMNRDLDGFGLKGDFVWVIEVDMAHQFHQVFLVNTRNQKLIGLLP